MPDDIADATGKHRTIDDCANPAESLWVKAARRWVAIIILALLGSLGGSVYTVISASMEAAELRAEVRHLAGLQAEIRGQLRELEAADRVLERDGADASSRVLVEMGALRAEVRQVQAAVSRLEATPRGRR